jgi:hypothetical protein
LCIENLIPEVIFANGACGEQLVIDTVIRMMELMTSEEEEEARRAGDSRL